MDSEDDFIDSGKKKKKGDDKENDFPEVSSDVPAKYMETKRGGRCLIDPFNYTYNKINEYKGKVFWRCCRERSTVLPR
jgi:hypothetical protein